MGNKVKTWSMLAKRMQMRASEGLADALKAGDRLAALQRSEVRLNELRADYVARLVVVEGGRHTMSENMNCRRYIAHVDELRGRLAGQLVAAQEELAHAKQVHQRLEVECAKLTQLAERALEAERCRLRAGEQARLDALAITRFNLR
jgi:flagellar export protein FliJ